MSADPPEWGTDDVYICVSRRLSQRPALRTLRILTRHETAVALIACHRTGAESTAKTLKRSLHIEARLYASSSSGSWSGSSSSGISGWVWQYTHADLSGGSELKRAALRIASSAAASGAPHNGAERSATASKSAFCHSCSDLHISFKNDDGYESWSLSRPEACVILSCTTACVLQTRPLAPLIVTVDGHEAFRRTFVFASAAVRHA